MSTRIWLASLAGSASLASAAEPLGPGLPPPSRPRGEAFVPGVSPADAPVLRPRPSPSRSPGLPAVKFPDAVDIVFYAKDRPVRVRVTIAEAGKPFAERWDTHVKDLFAHFDRDRDGVLNRFEQEFVIPVAGIAQILRGQLYYRNPAVPLVLGDLDRDGDGRVTPAELAAYYAPVTPKLIRPQPLPDAPPDARLTAELFARLDANGDGRLSRAEADDAARVLIALDGDEDECVSVSEVLANPLAQRTETSVKAPPVSPGGGPQDVAVSTAGMIPDLVPRLAERYEKTFPPARFAEWRGGPPDGTAAVTLASDPLAVRVTGTGSPGFAPGQTEPHRVVFRTGPQTLDLAADRRTLAEDKIVAQVLAGAGFPPGKSSVTEADIAGPQAQLLRILFDPADRNGDGKLTRDEATAHVRIQQRTAALALTVNFRTRTPSLFQLLDENGDGRLSTRELRAVWDRLIVLEPAGATAITTGVSQPGAVVRVARGSLQPDGVPVSPGPTPAATGGPLWFRKMDRNADGDVSAAEFLGDAATFAAIDTNDDGLISRAEAETYDATRRKK